MILNLAPKLFAAAGVGGLDIYVTVHLPAQRGGGELRVSAEHMYVAHSLLPCVYDYRLTTACTKAI